MNFLKEKDFFTIKIHDGTIRTMGVSAHFYLPPFGDIAYCHCTVHPVNDLAYNFLFTIALRSALVGHPRERCTRIWHSYFPSFYAP